MLFLLLIHSPLLGTSSWAPVSDLAASAGIGSAVPDLSASFADASGWSAAVAEVSAQACPEDRDVVVVGHSGAGHYLPLVGEAVGLDRVSFVFVDAVLPPLRGEVSPGAAIGSLLDAHTVDGQLAPWLDWWPAEVVDRILPDHADQIALRQDMPTVQRAIYGETLRMPDGWHERSVRYVRTSAAYHDEAELAGSRGWAVSQIDGNHLSIVTEPDRVLAHIVDPDTLTIGIST